MRSAGSMDSPAGSPRDALLRTPRRSLVTLAALVVLGVCVLALAVSTRPAEYDSVSRFTTAEHMTFAKRTLFPASARASVLHGATGARRSKQQLEEGAEGAEEEEEPASAGSLTPQEIEVKAKEWAEENPDEAHKIGNAVLVGLLIGGAGTVALIWSEIATVMTVRDLDACAWSGEPKPRELLERESMWALGFASSLRPYVSLAGVAAILAGWLVACVPLCSVLADFGMPEAAQSADCITSMVFLAVLNTFTFAALATGVCWTCTRPWAALILALIALWGNLAEMIMNPFFTIAWALVSAGVLVYYLAEIPESKPGHRRPPGLFGAFGSSYMPPQPNRGSPQTEGYV